MSLLITDNPDALSTQDQGVESNCDAITLYLQIGTVDQYKHISRTRDDIKTRCRPD